MKGTGAEFSLFVSTLLNIGSSETIHNSLQQINKIINNKDF